MMFEFMDIICLIVLGLVVYLIYEIRKSKTNQSLKEPTKEQDNLEIITPKVLSKKQVQIIGVGGGGSNIVEYLTSSYPKQYTSLIINSDKKALESKKVKNKILLEKPDGYGCGSNEKCGFSLIDTNSLDKIKNFITKKRVYIVVTLGGGVGSGSTKAIVQSLYESGKKVHLIAIKPFSWEGAKKSIRANDTLEFIESYCKKIYLLENDTLKQHKELSMKECFEILNEKVHQVI